MVTTNENIINRKIILIRKGLSISDVAKKLAYSRQGINKAIIGKTRSESMLNAISKVLGISKEEFWPEFYRPAENINAVTVSHNSKIDEVSGAVN